MKKAKIKTLIVDDEPHARRLIRTLLAKEKDFEVSGECENGREAIIALKSRRLDLVFLDVQMPEIDGFDVLLALPPDRLPAVIFVTAYDKYAVRAFEVHALDYLLKPVDEDRFNQALERARLQLKGEQLGETQQKLESLVHDLRKQRLGFERLLVKSAGRIMFLPHEDVDWIEAAGNYMRIHAGGEIHLMRETMAGLAKKLDPNRFVRIHRSAMVNLHRIKELAPSRKGEFDVFLQNGDRLTLSRKFRPVVEAALGKKL
ncbi:MAG: LytR/AlgR family response regulator transcription factor [Planctomycetota bacterium]|jgi:two-component system LytT family response regulator